MGRIATVCYRAKSGKEAALHALCASHYARLYRQGLVSRRLPVFMIAGDGSVVQVLEWKSQHAIEVARAHPLVAELRREYQEVSDLVPLASLPEATESLALFDSAPFDVELPPFHKVYNHVQVDERISTSGVVTAEVIEQIAREGYSGLINLLPDASPHALKDEAGQARAKALAYEHIPVDFAAPTRADYVEFERALDAFDPRQRVYVHCAANMRVSVFMAIYGVRRMGWSAERAALHVAEVWEPNPVWRTFLDAELARA